MLQCVNVEIRWILLKGQYSQALILQLQLSILIQDYKRLSVC